MTKSPSLLTFLAAAGLALALFGTQHALSGDDGHSHGHGHGHDKKKLPEIPQTVPGAWKVIQESVAKMEKGLQSGQHDLIHKNEASLQAGLKILKRKSDVAGPKNQARLLGAIRQASKAGNALHHAADHGDKKGMAKKLTQLKGTLKVIAAQYPEGTLNAAKPE